MIICEAGGEEEEEERGEKKKNVFCQEQVLQAPSWGCQGQACWHCGSICLVPRTPLICISFIWILQSRNALLLQKWSQKWALQLITSEIYRLMKSHNSTFFFFCVFFKKKKKEGEWGKVAAASAVNPHSLFDECAFKAVAVCLHLKTGWKEEKQQWETLWDAANAITHENSSSVWAKRAASTS